MPFAVKSTLQTIASYMEASGYLDNVTIGEPKEPVQGQGLSAAIFMASASVAGTVLNAPIEVHTVTIRIYADMLREPLEANEYEISEVVGDILGDLMGEYDLGATVRNIDVAGQYGAAIGTTWGYLDLGGKLYRYADISIPLVVDPAVTFAA